MNLLPPGERIIETKKCKISGQDFFVTDKDLEFYDTISPVFGGKKYTIPSPTLCPDERQRRRLCFRNERKLYHRKCDKTGNQIISIYSPDKPYKVYDQKVWWGDGWNSFEYGSTFDFSQGFFEQFLKLQSVCPKMALHAGRNLENAQFTNHGGNMKNCYLCFNTNYCEDAYYNTAIGECKNIIDCLKTYQTELGYESVDCYKCYNIKYCQDCENCSNSFFLKDCSGCKNCFMCTNLTQKEFMIYNKQCSKGEYLKFIKNIQENFTTKKYITDFDNLKLSSVQVYDKNLKTQDVIGNYIKNSNKCFGSFDLYDCENLKYCDGLMIAKDSIDISYFGTGIGFSLECCSSGYEFSNNLFCANSWQNISFSLYCTHCLNGIASCFGCSSLKKAHHCILNKPYSVAEYEEHSGKIIDHMRSTGEWGEFFPHELSPFGYDETVAQEYFPMTEEEIKNMPRFPEWRNGKPSPFGKGDVEPKARQGDFATQEKSFPPLPLRRDRSTSFQKEDGDRGWNWKGEEETSSYHGLYYTPLSIDQYDEKIVGYEVAKKNIDELLNGILQCEITKKPFKVIRQELAFYIENHIPIPTKHPDQRHKERMQLRNPRKLFERKCAECGTDMITTYAPERPEKVVCEKCYQKFVY